MRYLHTMVRVKDIDEALDFYVKKLGLKEVRRHENQQGRYTLIFLAAPEDFLSPEDAAAVRRPVTRRWTVADVPLLDEAAELLGVDDRVARTRAEREREEQIAYAQGVLDVSYASRTYEFEDKDEEDVAPKGAKPKFITGAASERSSVGNQSVERSKCSGQTTIGVCGPLRRARKRAVALKTR